MKSRLTVAALVAALVFAALPLPSLAQVSVAIGITVGAPPPAIPYYEQPPVPTPNYLWMPGYWSWGPGGYGWVPGTWVLAPQPGLYWTPGYWAWNGYGYSWNQGYWANSVGYYGGVNYGAGYYGNGYDGGRWSGRNFQYNTYVTHVDRGNRYVYADRSVYVNNSSTARVSYVGGTNGLRSSPTAAQTAVAHARHYGATPVQLAHVQAASQNRNMLATVNHGRPASAAVAQPLSAARRPAAYAAVTSHDRATAQTSLVHKAAAAPAARNAAAAPAVHKAAAAPAARNAAAAPAVHKEAAAPAARNAAPAQRAAAPVHRAAPLQHAAAPAQRAAQRGAAPAQHAARAEHKAAVRAPGERG